MFGAFQVKIRNLPLSFPVLLTYISDNILLAFFVVKLLNLRVFLAIDLDLDIIKLGKYFWQIWHSHLMIFTLMIFCCIFLFILSQLPIRIFFQNIRRCPPNADCNSNYIPSNGCDSTPYCIDCQDVIKLN